MKVYEGAIVTCDRLDNVYRYLVEDRGRIVFTGNELPGEFKGAPVESLADGSLVPAFGDTHIHFLSYAAIIDLDVRSARSIADICRRVSDYAAAGKGRFIVGGSASAHSVEEKRLITREELDRACPDRAVFMVKYDGHACIVNSRMIEALPAKVRSMRGYHADTGEMNQEAFFATLDFITKKVSIPRTFRNMVRAIDNLAEKGIGMMHTMSGLGYLLDIDVTMETLFGRGLDTGFQSRVFFQTMDVAKVKRRKLPRIGGCFATALDGCFGSMDAALNEPYSNDPENRGVLFYPDGAVTEFCKRANRAGLQIELHAIGDAAFDQALRALEAALEDFPRKDHRHGIIHACLPTERGLGKCAELGIHIPLQPAFLDWDLEPYDYLKGILGYRVDRISPLRKMTDMGIVLSGGSDAPCTLPDPIFGMYCACNHCVPGQSLTIQEALKMFTCNSAWTTFDEKDRGSLEAGKMADMAVLNRNPLAMQPGELLSLRVEKLLLNGEPYKKGQGVLSLLAKGILGKAGG
jgi:hypothetical protein